MNAKNTSGMRGYITKSRAGHYTAAIRDRETGVLILVIDKLPSLSGARQVIAATKEAR